VALREAGIELRGNEDVTLGRLFKQARCGLDVGLQPPPQGLQPPA
jgi:hypothetical protein